MPPNHRKMIDNVEKRSNAKTYIINLNSYQRI
jgi:hypothetical protein